jgi:small conductance mechanosensitive channel
MIRLQTDILSGLTTSIAEQDSTAIVKATKEIESLKTSSFDQILDQMLQSLVHFAINLAVAILVFYVGRFVIRKIYKIISTIFIHRRLDKSLSTFILSVVNIVLYFILIVTVIGILGIETSSFLAIFASAGVALGMALSGTLQNFAGGVLILLLKPYKIGDYIEVQGYAGTVREIQIFSTIITTYDNKSISIPNGGLSTGSVNNWSREAFRRVTWDISISYGDSIKDARDAIMKMFATDARIEQAELPKAGKSQEEYDTDSGDTVAFNPQEAEADGELTADEEKKPAWYKRILHHQRKAKAMLEERRQQHRDSLMEFYKKPDYSPKVLVNELGDSAVVLQVRAWTKTDNYWNVFYYYNEKFYTELPKHNIHFPFPQMDVHLSN